MSEFINSDYCEECGGVGYYIWPGQDAEQCERCLELHDDEVRADMLHDEMKGV